MKGESAMQIVDAQIHRWGSGLPNATQGFAWRSITWAAGAG
jgi:hypothetical protein